MVDSQSLSWRRLGIVVVLLGAALLAARLPLAASPRSVASNREFDDETELTAVTADHFLGISIGELHWPGATNQLLLLPIFALDFVRTTHGRPSPERFAAYLSDLYRSPYHAVWLGRMLVALISSGGLASLYIPFRHRLQSNALAVAVIFALGLSPIVWQNCATASAAGMAMGMIALATTVGMTGQSSKPRLAWVGVLCGLCLAARLVYVPVLPLALTLFAMRSSRPIRAVLWIGLWALIAFFFVCPFVWTEPIRFVRAVVGNYLKHGPPVGWIGVLRIFNHNVPPFLTVLFLISLIIAAGQKKWLLIAASAISVMALVGPSTHSPMVTPRYFVTMPFVLTLAVVAILPAAPTWRMANLKPIYLHAGLLIFITLGCAWSLRSVVLQDRKDKLQAAIGIEVVDRILSARSDDRPIAVDAALGQLLESSASSASLRELSHRIELNQLHGGRVLEFAAGFGFDPHVVSALLDDFNEKERTAAARYRAAAGAVDRPGLDLRLIAAAKDHRSDCILPEEAFAQWRRGELRLVVISQPPPPNLHPVVELSKPGATDRYYLLEAKH